jgi:predicted RNase H-like nuclease
MKIERYIGVDGCRAGWFIVCLGPGEKISFDVFPNIEMLWAEYGNTTSMILVDIPIGLPFRGIPTRQCDKEARRILGARRHSSIFSPPCRDALKAGSYKEACRINREITGRKISRQAWGITPKILEVEELLRRYPEAPTYIRETHPEVCYWSLNDRKIIPHSKKSKEGFEERITILKSLLPKSESVVNAALGKYRRSDVARDDILDALILAVTGFAAKGKLSTIPERPEKDVSGLTMEIVY